MRDTVATKTGAAGGVVAGLRSIPRLGYELQDARRDEREGSARAASPAISDLQEALTGGSWRHALALNGSIGGTRLA